MNKIFSNEAKLRKKYGVIAGIDEAGRGPLAGPVVVAAVVLGSDFYLEELNDSKKLSSLKRELIYEIILDECLAFHISVIEPAVIDEMNILNATLKGMRESYYKLKFPPDYCLIDGNKTPQGMPKSVVSVVKGDSKFASISAASILAKVKRDEIMRELDKKYPVYNFKQNKGYPTKEHLAIIRKYGITKEHRLSFKPVHQLEINI
mgnify:CR=1 FL=1